MTNFTVFTNIVYSTDIFATLIPGLPLFFGGLFPGFPRFFPGSKNANFKGFLGGPLSPLVNR